MSHRHDRSFSWARFDELPVVGIVRGFATATLADAVAAARAGGLRCVEITMNSPDAATQIALLARSFGTDMNVGAGTVCSLDALERARAAGASFIVTPVLVPEVVAAARKAGLTVFPGAMTPTEVFAAWKLGADLVKVFPASVLGPEYIRDLKAPFGDVRLMPTGGIGVEHIAAYTQAGADGFGVGSPLFDRARIEAGDWAWIEARARSFASAYSAAKQGRSSQVGS